MNSALRFAIVTAGVLAIATTMALPRAASAGATPRSEHIRDAALIGGVFAATRTKHL